MLRSTAVAVAAVMALAAVSACSRGASTASRTARNKTVIPKTARAINGPAIRGEAQLPDGTPAAGVTVYAEVQLSKTEQFFRGFKAFASLGIGCLDQEGCSLPQGAAISALDGTFAIPVPEGGHTPKGIILTAVLDKTPARVATALSLPRSALNGVDVGVVPIAASAPTLTQTAGRTHLNPPRVPGAHPDAATVMMARIQTTGDQQQVANGSEVDVSDGVDLRLVEDGRVLLTTTQQGHVGAYRALVSSSLPLTGTMVPLSRGAACQLTGGKGQLIEQKPCGLTDGVLDDSWHPQDDPACSGGPCTDGTAQRDHRDIYVSLHVPIRATLLVIRGCGFTCHVSVTDTAGTHALHDTSDAGTDAMYIATLDGLPLSKVHVVTATGGFVSSLREVSIWR